ncbi:LEAF RUST 10 DISEASE-RESISTANCE LOCUS RECEPTOR-LIKE PROTEIN KINASE-like 2.2 [Sesamum alatum]|uniref:non-specific serine/threonine protein kinase n=1 Tax=Sesamum alatum TaxID=300844 RepID=A0AAE1XRX8_9LAMI|nr:LEAF RUST 10 DISEASE-RESISTANCE LOCUS RECEPTOR-LIKE PROTEIN KINASE-like 2.2 [Sesamum alatum]
MLRSLVITLTAALLTAAYSQPTTTTYPNCNRTFSCGPITNITYPFSGGDRPAHCGLPDFALTCRNNTITELIQNSLTYRVLQLDQAQRTLILSRSDLYNDTCPAEFHNTTLNSTLFSYDGPPNEALNLFYGCNTSGMRISPYNLFPCNSTGLNFTDAYFLIGPVPSDPVLRIVSCSMSVSVPVLRTAGNQLTNSRLSLGEALMQGFAVNYSDPYQRLCSECSRLGGQCGFDSVLGRPLCICGDRPCPFALTLKPEGSTNATGPFVGSRKVLSDLHKYVIIGVSLGIAGIVISSVIIFYIRKQFKMQEADQEISHKSDVYSYGMMLLEMAGARNFDGIEAIQSSENYFPDKIYKHVVLKNEKLDDLMTDEQEETARKMLLVGLWCIQTAPSDRPSMTKRSCRVFSKWFNGSLFLVVAVISSWILISRRQPGYPDGGRLGPGG